MPDLHHLWHNKYGQTNSVWNQTQLQNCNFIDFEFNWSNVMFVEETN
jgi:hypothetical protein